jgi:hypothetical protein
MDEEVSTHGQFAYPCVYAAICHILVSSLSHIGTFKIL